MAEGIDKAGRTGGWKAPDVGIGLAPLSLFVYAAGWGSFRLPAALCRAGVGELGLGGQSGVSQEMAALPQAGFAPGPASPVAPRLHTSPWQFVVKPSWLRGDCTAGHFLQFLPFACRHGYLGPGGGEVEVGWNQFCPGFYFRRCGSARGAVTSGSVSREAKGPGGTWVWLWRQGASPASLPEGVGVGQGEAPRRCRKRRGLPYEGLCRWPWALVSGQALRPKLPEHAGSAQRGCLFSWPGALSAETLFQALGCQIHPH